MAHILIVDDDLGPRESLKASLAGKYTVSAAESAKQALDMLSKSQFDLVLLDVIMPEKDGLELLKDVQSMYPSMPAVMISASTSVHRVVESMRGGALDYLTKPWDVEHLLSVVARTLENTKLRRRVKALETEVAREFPVEGIVGESSSFRRAMNDVRKAAATDATVLLGGESGTGKELAARLLHAMSARAEEPFVAVHCAALPEALMESELFGHEKGAFTGADKQKPGRFDLAGSGTLFFDEVGEMPLSTQVKLLRVLQEREFMRVGGTRVIKTNARLVAATARDLREEVKKETFRDDLFYRLSVVPVNLPALRERRQDIPLLSQYFLELFARSLDVTTEGLEPEAMQLLTSYSWPGNIRELRNIIERMLVLHGKERLIAPEFLPEEFHAEARERPDTSSGSGTLQEVVNAFERDLIAKALEDTNGVQTRAAELLGTTRRILRYRMEKLEIPARN